MKMLADFLAVILFFVAYYVTKDIKIATIVAIVIGVAQAAFIYIKHKKLDGLQIASVVLIVVFGGLTVYLDNPIFIKWKPSLLFFCFAFAIYFGKHFTKGKKTVLESLLGKDVQLPPEVWSKLTLMWVGFFVFLALANLFVVYYWYGDDDLWVKYKTFGATSLLVIFSIGVSVWLSKYITDPEDEKAAQVNAKAQAQAQVAGADGKVAEASKASNESSVAAKSDSAESTDSNEGKADGETKA